MAAGTRQTNSMEAVKAGIEARQRDIGGRHPNRIVDCERPVYDS